MDDLGSYVVDDGLAVEPLARLGHTVETLSWRQTSRPWSEFDAVIIRTPWDYHDSPDQFLDVLRAISAKTRLENPLSIVEWNLDKNYLSDIAARGVRIVPTIWSREYSAENFKDWTTELACGEIVIKPTVSATARNTFRLAEYDPSIESVFAEREFMVQPFVESIVDEGEYSFFYFAGEYSHAIQKVPKAGDFRVQEEHGGFIESVSASSGVSSSIRAAADDVIHKLNKPLLYARVDLVSYDGDHSLMELELIEPSLYLRTSTAAPENFARAIDRYFR